MQNQTLNQKVPNISKNKTKEDKNQTDKKEKSKTVQTLMNFDFNKNKLFKS